ncbi:MAG TPA: hypothetical protein VIE36_20055 [Methylomirabilota bacterium]|jgi:hypothetical protein
MNAHAVTYPAVQRRLITHRRQRALFLVRTTQHVKTRRLLIAEVARAAIAALALIAWSASLLLIAG